MGRHLSKGSKLARYELTLPRQTIQRLKLVRAVTGIPIKEWLRAQVMMAVDLELCRRPGAFWLRPGARIYRMNMAADDPTGLIPVPLTVSQGGERVWIMEILPDLDVGRGDEGLGKDEQHGAVLCDLSADEDGQVEMRRVLVASADVLARDVAYNTGLGAIKLRKARELRRKASMEKMRRDAAQSGGVDSAGDPA